MKVLLEKTFAMPGSADAAWAVLQDIESVAACMPGAKLTERIDAQHFKGQVAIKFGPASMAFRGEVLVVSQDAAARTLTLSGKGTDATGSSGAAMELQARIEPVDASSSTLVGASEVSVSGKAAAFGGRMMDSVAEQVLKQFAANFAARVQAVQAQAPPVQPPAAEATPTAAAAPTAVAAADDPARAGAPVRSPSAPSQTAAEAAPLNGFAFAWAVFKNWLRSLFGA
ncbi:MAG TPA: SRPBCC family protein, partial [Variovorax sp.]|nr:SRPBCC family protein [Variovorax sp.]